MRITASSLLLSLLVATPAYADDEPSAMDWCRDISLIARDVMYARQSNVPMSSTLPNTLDELRNMFTELGVDINDMDEEQQEAFGQIEELITRLVMDAYEVPAWDLESLQNDAVNSFENSAFSYCYQGFLEE